MSAQRRANDPHYDLDKLDSERFFYLIEMPQVFALCNDLEVHDIEEIATFPCLNYPALKQFLFYRSSLSKEKFFALGKHGILVSHRPYVSISGRYDDESKDRCIVKNSYFMSVFIAESELMTVEDLALWNDKRLSSMMHILYNLQNTEKEVLAAMRGISDEVLVKVQAKILQKEEPGICRMSFIEEFRGEELYKKYLENPEKCTLERDQLLTAFFYKWNLCNHRCKERRNKAAERLNRDDILRYCSLRLHLRLTTAI